MTTHVGALKAITGLSGGHSKLKSASRPSTLSKLQKGQLQQTSHWQAMEQYGAVLLLVASMT